MEPVGLYVHFPFCVSKCPYCDFYSATATEDGMDAYADAVINAVRMWKNKGVTFDTVYFGGGTPSLMGGARLGRIARMLAGEPIREFTVECNPSAVEPKLFAALREAGVDRISMGLQSAVDTERRALGRRADGALVERRVREAKQAGFTNITLDLMLGIPGQTPESLDVSLDFCRRMDVPHVSAYLLKIEPGTPFAARALDLPDEDAVCDLYLRAVSSLERMGLRQYEISNFARPGFEGQHNLKYWDCREYIGIGPAAHSFFGGKRFYYTRDTRAFLGGAQPVPDGDGGSFAEYAMLRLRLRDGLTEEETRKRFGFSIPDALRQAARKLPGSFVECDASGVRLTAEGFLISNALIAALLEDF